MLANDIFRMLHFGGEEAAGQEEEEERGGQEGRKRQLKHRFETNTRVLIALGEHFSNQTMSGKEHFITSAQPSLPHPSLTRQSISATSIFTYLLETIEPEFSAGI